MDIPENYKDIESYDVRHGPAIAAFCDKIELSAIVDKALDCNMDISCGKIVKGLILNTLSGRDPLYRVEDYFSHQDTELLIGRGIDSSAFSDDNIGRVFDRIFSYGTSKLFSEISLEAVKKFNIDTTQIHHDTTSVSVWGAYENSKYSGSPFEITLGHSKDKRPDLIQFVISLLCAEKDLPIETRIYSGNEDDKTISKGILKRISAYMADYSIDSEGFIYTGDCVMVTEPNLVFMGGAGNPKVKFISRMPATFSVVNTLIAEAVAKNDWTGIGMLSEEIKKQSASYRSYERDVIIGINKFRAAVIYSDYYDKRKKKSIDKKIVKDLESVKALMKKLTATQYYCIKDARIAAEKVRLPKYHKLNITIKEKTIYKKGRPKNGQKEVGNTRYTLSCGICPDDKLIKNLKEEAGCFVLITNVDKDKYPAAEILKIYKEQHGIEKNFGFLKDPLIVNDLFLKKTERIEALGFILVISLLIWRLVERCLRGYIKEKNITITGWDKKQTGSPTTFMMTTKFCSVHTLKKGDIRWLSRKISDVQRQYLDALGLSEEIFYTVSD
jgi:transposase